MRSSPLNAGVRRKAPEDNAERGSKRVRTDPHRHSQQSTDPLPGLGADTPDGSSTYTNPMVVGTNASQHPGLQTAIINSHGLIGPSRNLPPVPSVHSGLNPDSSESSNNDDSR